MTVPIWIALGLIAAWSASLLVGSMGYGTDVEASYALADSRQLRGGAPWTIGMWMLST